MVDLERCCGLYMINEEGEVERDDGLPLRHHINDNGYPAVNFGVVHTA